jgi:hypothetical protein
MTSYNIIASTDKNTVVAEYTPVYDTLTSDISSGLLAEIEACRKQYEYYRDKLLLFPSSGRFKNSGREAVYGN